MLQKRLEKFSNILSFYLVVLKYYFNSSIDAYRFTQIRMNLEGFNLSNVCRLCLRSSEDLKNIFAEEQGDEQPKMDLAARITACVALEVIFVRF